MGHSPEKRSRNRKSRKEIIVTIFKVLNDGRTHNADEISRLSDLSWISTVHWLDLIALVQDYPKVNQERVGRTNLYRVPFEQTRRR